MATASENPDAPPPDEAAQARAANRFDIRRLIGALFAVYAIILIVLGLVGSHTIKHKADNIDIDLWAGIGMLLFAVFMIAWALLRPTAVVAGGPAEAAGTQTTPGDVRS